MIHYSTDTKDVLDAIRRMRAVAAPGGLDPVWHLVGSGLAARMKKNYVASGLRIRTGNLINSLGYELFKRRGYEGVMVGSFGVPYAAIHEFGWSGAMSVPSHTRKSHQVKAHERRITKAFGRDIPARMVEVRPYTVSAHTVKPHTRDVNIKERAYMRRSIAADRQRILRLINNHFDPDNGGAGPAGSKI